MKNIRLPFLMLLLSALLMGCNISDSNDNHVDDDENGDDDIDERVDTGDLDASRIVAMGNSLTAGVMHGGWTYDGLYHSYATQIARQIYGDEYVGDDPDEHQFLLGRIKDPGNPVPGGIEALEQVGTYEDGTPVYLFDITAPRLRFGDALQTENYDAEPNFNNLAVPGFMGLDVLNTHSFINALGELNALYALPLRDRGPQIEQSLVIDPTFVILWVGNNEALRAALSGGTTPSYPLEGSSPTPGFRLVLEELLQPYAGTDTKVILATVPDVTSIPFVTEVGVSTSDGTRGFITGQPGGVWADTLTMYGRTPDGEVRPILDSEHVLLDWLLIDYGNNDPPGLNPSDPLSDDLWLTETQLQNIKQAVEGYNYTIRNAAEGSDNIIVADMHGFYKTITENGGIDGFEHGIFGGLFSLDGVHPGKVGHAYVANEFIKVINEEFSARIPLLNPEDFIEESPLPSGRKGMATGQRNAAYQQSKEMIMPSDQSRLP